MKAFLTGLALFFILRNANSQFITLGDAEPMDKSCVKLTNDYPYSEGIAYSTSTLNLSAPFQIEFEIYLGDKDELGADGIVFVIHSDPRGFDAYGTFGEFLGYGGRSSRSVSISPSVAVEFDTYQNPWQNDPESDHVAWLENGINYHQSYYSGKKGDWNLEDGELHNFRFRWNPATKEILVQLDNEIAIQTTKDLVKEIFNGKTRVIWGFTASTGNKHNLQYFCFRRMASLER